VSFMAIILCVASQRVFIVIYFVIDSVRKLLDTTSYLGVATQFGHLDSPRSQFKEFVINGNALPVSYQNSSDWGLIFMLLRRST
jgi:uncharacterized membrane protein